MKYVLFLLSIIVFSSCSFQPFLKLVYHVKSPDVFETKQQAEIALKKILDKKAIDYRLYYRTKDYYNTLDTADFSKRVWVFNKNGERCRINTSQFNVCSNVSQRVLTHKDYPLDSLPVDTSYSIETYFNYIYNVNEKHPEFSQLPMKDYYLILDWTTFFLGPQNKNLRKLKKQIQQQEKDVLYLFVSKDIIIDSSSVNDFKFPQLNKAQIQSQ